MKKRFREARRMATIEKGAMLEVRRYMTGIRRKAFPVDATVVDNVLFVAGIGKERHGPAFAVMKGRLAAEARRLGARRLER